MKYDIKVKEDQSFKILQFSDTTTLLAKGTTHLASLANHVVSTAGIWDKMDHEIAALHFYFYCMAYFCFNPNLESILPINVIERIKGRLCINLHVNKWITPGCGNGSSPVRRQAITRTMLSCS